MTIAGIEYLPRSPSSASDEVLDVAAIAHVAGILFDTEIKQAGRHWTLEQGHTVMLTIDRSRPGKAHRAVYTLVLICFRISACPIVTVEAENPTHGLSLSLHRIHDVNTPSNTCAHASRMTIRDIRLTVSRYWPCFTVQKMDWEQIGAQLALLPAFEGLTVSLERELFQDEPEALHAQLRVRFPADIPLYFEARNVLPYTSPAQMVPSAFREHLRRNTMPKAKASADSAVRSSSKALQDTSLT